jgi:transposase-like protein
MADSQRYYDGDWLEEQYVNQGRTVPEIAAECGVSRATIRKWMDRHDISTTGRGKVPDDTRYRDAEWLAYAYHEQEMSMHDIAAECGVAAATVHRWMDKFNIETRDRGLKEGGYNPMKNPEVVEDHPITGLSGEDHPSWEGGQSHDWLHSGEWEQTREKRIQMAAKECERCGLPRQASYETFGEDLHVHHILPVPAGGEKYDHDNLAVLCRDCHEDTHDAHDSPPYEPEV